VDGAVEGRLAGGHVRVRDLRRVVGEQHVVFDPAHLFPEGQGQVDGTPDRAFRDVVERAEALHRRTAAAGTGVDLRTSRVVVGRNGQGNGEGVGCLLGRL